MTFGDVNEQGYDFRLMIFMDRKYNFGDFNSLSAMDGHDHPLKN
jgi:hypothetical protein